MHQRYRSSRLFSADEPHSSLLYLRHLCHGDFGRLENSATLAGLRLLNPSDESEIRRAGK